MGQWDGSLVTRKDGASEPIKQEVNALVTGKKANSGMSAAVSFQFRQMKFDVASFSHSSNQKSRGTQPLCSLTHPYRRRQS